ncbi:MAG: hypothetical protein QM811_18955 [Pirellulales bacterium]
MKTNGQSIYGSQRTQFSESNLGDFVATSRDSKLFFHVNPETIQPICFGLHGGKIKSSRSLEDARVQITDLQGNTYQVNCSEKSAVIEIECEKSISKITPAKVLMDQSHSAGDNNAGIVFGGGKYDPMPEKMITAKSLAVSKKESSDVELELRVAVAGRYRLEIGINSQKTGPVTVQVGKEKYKSKAWHADILDMLTFDDLMLPEGNLPIVLKSNLGQLDIYAVRLQPIWRPIDSTLWQTVGPFQTGFGAHQPISEVKRALLRIDPPQLSSGGHEMNDALGRPVTWNKATKCLGEHSKEGINFPYRVARDYIGVCFARTQIISLEERDAELQLGVDWWANAWINGTPIVSDRSPTEIQKDGAQFNAWRPGRARFRLKKGKNILLVKCHPGTAACWFTCWISDPGDLKITSSF